MEIAADPDSIPLPSARPRAAPSLPGPISDRFHSVEIERGRYRCREGEALLSALILEQGREIPVGCRSGGCGVCRVQVVSGDYDVRVMSRAHVSVGDQAAGVALACCIIPRSDLIIRVLGRKPCRTGDAQ